MAVHNLEEQLERELTNKGYSMVEELTQRTVERPVDQRLVRSWKLVKGGQTLHAKVTSEYFPSPDASNAQREAVVEGARREADTLSRLRGNFGFPVYLGDFIVGESGEPQAHVLLTKFITHPSLQTRMEQGETLDESQLITLLERGFGALNKLNQQTPPVFHRDLKPAHLHFSDSFDEFYMTDFNFSSTAMSESTTMIVPTGYYPLQHAEAKPRRSYDVYALGVIAVCASLGKPIQTIIAEYGLRLGDPLPIDDLPVSEGMKHYLAKLTHPNENVRFPSVLAAGNGLHQVRAGDTAGLRRSVNTVVRSDEMAELIKLLEEKDPFFDFHFSKGDIHSLGDDPLMRKMEAIYSTDTFRVEDPEFVAKYTQAGDRVVLYENATPGIPGLEGERVQVVSVDNDCVTITYKGREFYVTAEDLRVDGYALLKNLAPGKLAKGRTLSALPIRDSHTGYKWRYHAKPDGDLMKKEGLSIVFAVSNDGENPVFAIAKEFKGGYDRQNYQHRGGRRVGQTNYMFTADNFALERQNDVGFEDLVRKAYLGKQDLFGRRGGGSVTIS